MGRRNRRIVFEEGIYRWPSRWPRSNRRGVKCEVCNRRRRKTNRREMSREDMEGEKTG